MNLIIVITLKMGDLGEVLLTYHVTADKDFTRFEPNIPQYKTLKNDEIVPLELKITDQNNNIITNGLGTAIVLHIQ